MPIVFKACLLGSSDGESPVFEGFTVLGEKGAGTGAGIGIDAGTGAGAGAGVGAGGSGLHSPPELFAMQSTLSIPLGQLSHAMQPLKLGTGWYMWEGHGLQVPASARPHAPLLYWPASQKQLEQ
jgi:hypothetical protein